VRHASPGPWRASRRLGPRADTGSVLTFLLQALDTVATGTLHLFPVVFLAVTGLWLIRFVLSRRYAPWTAPHLVSTAVIIPVVDEPVDLFTEVLHRIIAQRPTELVVVINGPRNVVLEQVCDRLRVSWRWSATPGKRGAVAMGVRHTTSDILVLVDSDTLWTPNTLSELMKPFANPQVGGVTTRQHILAPYRTVWTRWAEWLEWLRNAYSMPAMSVLGTVGCLPGRTIALRRDTVERNMDKFLGEKFLGIFQEISDDRTLTNYALMDGYQTVYQDTSVVYTDAPTELPKLVKQQFRWARGSQYNTLRMMPWMMRNARWLAVLYAGDILVPFLIVGVVLAWITRAALDALTTNPYTPLLEALGTAWWVIPALVGVAIAMSVLFAAIRYARPLEERPGQVLWLPVYMLINIFLLIPIRLWGFLRMAQVGGWGTRAGAFAAGSAHPGFVLVPYLIAVIVLGAIISGGLALHA
jgi:hyaluronan synthase